MKFRTSILGLVVISLVSPAFVRAVSAQNIAGVQGPPSVCRDSNGSLKEGDLDVLVAFDDSRSLSGSKGQRGSDEEGRRFDALEEFLSAFAKTQSTRKKNFGLIKFGSSAEETIPIGEITPENFEEKATEIRRKIPNSRDKQQSQTNYVAALQKAFDIFEQQDTMKTNCKVLIWFTDGVYDRSNSTKQEADKEDASHLKGEVCESGQLADKIQNGDINTFVVFLKGANNPSFKNRRTASQDAMQAITGDAEPNFGSKSESRDVSDSDCSIENRRHLGEVLSAQDASELAGYLVDLVLVADGGKPIIEGDCPIQLDEAQSVELPDGRFIEWLSITTWNKSPDIDTESFTIRSNGKTLSFEDIFSVAAAKQKDERSRRYVIKKSEVQQLSAGWSIASTKSSRTCIRAKVRDLTFKVKKNTPQFSPISPGDLPEKLYENLIQLFDDQGNLLTVDEALSVASQSGRSVSGRLRVAKYSNLAGGDSSPDADLLAVKILADGKLEVSPSNCSLRVEYLDNDERSKNGERLTSNEDCRVVPSTENVTQYDATKAFDELATACPQITNGWQLLQDGKVVPPSGELKQGGDTFDLALQSTDPAPKKKVECRNLKTRISFSTATDTTVEVPVTVNLSLLKPESALWPLLALLLVIFFTLLSFLVLRLVNLLFIRAPSKDLFFGYVTNASLVPGDFDRAAIRWATASREFEIEATKLQPTKGDESRRSLSVGGYRFELRVPRLLRPFEHARLVLVDDRPAVFWRANSEKDGFPLSFTNGISLIATSTNVPTAERATDVDVVVFVPKRGGDAGLDGVAAALRSNLGDLAPQLMELLRRRAAQIAKESEADAEKANKKQEPGVQSPARGNETKTPPAQPPLSQGQPLTPPPAPPSRQPSKPPSSGPNGNTPGIQPPNPPRPPEPPSR